MPKTSLEELLNNALYYAKQGEIEKARELYKAASKAFPKSKRVSQSLAHLDLAKPIVSDKQVPKDLVNKLVGLFNQRKFRSVVELGAQVTKQYPDAFIIWNILGAANSALGRTQIASEAFEKVTRLNPKYADGFNNLGVSLQRQGKLSKAIKAYKNAVKIKPNYAEAYHNLGHVFKEQGKLDDAIDAYNQATNIKPGYAEAYNNTGVALHNKGKVDEAIDAYNQAINIKPDYAEAYNNLGASLQQKNELKEAINAYNKALNIKPVYTEAYNNRGTALQHQGKWEEAIDAFRKAITIKPDYAEAHHNLSFALLNSGRLKEGLEEYEWRWKVSKNAAQYRQFSQPMWDGKEKLKDKTILLWCEQGVGDTINWASRLPLIASQSKHCILECQEKLIPLLARSFPDVEIRAEDRRNDARRNDCDFHIPMGSLYKYFISEIAHQTKIEAFLVPDPARINFWRGRLEALGDGPFIGVSWKSADLSQKRLPNYAPISDWSPIFEIPGVTFINLQYANYSDDLNEIKDRFGVIVHNFDDLDHFNDLDDVAALCAALDMVVSTKITVPLISAGVGTFTNLANWEQSPWNNFLLNPAGPMVDIFDKNTSDTWHDVFKKISKNLKAKYRL